MGGGGTHVGDFGGVSHRNHAFRDYRVELTNFSNARIHTGYVLGEVRGRCVGGGSGGGHT